MGFKRSMEFKNQPILFSGVLSALLILLLIIPNAHSATPLPSNITTTKPGNAETDMQALVMDLADEYISFLGESVYLLMRSDELDSKGRWMAQSFLRNGVGASLDIAVGPNPHINMLDLLG